MSEEQTALGYKVVVVLRGRDGDLVSREHYSLEEAKAELAKLEQPAGDGRLLVKVAEMLVDPKDVKAAFLREVREGLIERLARAGSAASW